MKTIKFYRVDEPYGCFSNFSSHPIFLDGTTWRTSEHYFQAQKFLDYKHKHEILMTQSPMIAARIGRDQNRPLRPDWEIVKDDIMRKAVHAKIMQHAEVRELLFSTKDCQIVEHTTNDSYWGDGGNGLGKNMLGIILMEIRDELLKDGNYDELKASLNPPWIEHPEIERYSIGWRMGYGEDYICKWGSWYSGLSEEGKVKYHAMFPPPEEWEGYWEE